MLLHKSERKNTFLSSYMFGKYFRNSQSIQTFDIYAFEFSISSISVSKYLIEIFVEVASKNKDLNTKLMNVLKEKVS
ncbi:CLUMA_CG014966, isoform A [Clunio marinus]|uniref:CLUMA_CG014966, isoform A n=1 Tax=Clunio marinus TaxID=568069 RepID=A0A1J1IRP2_9DIPT|nr:CLUMA_CG014966, isoform A [Clunio marinus]